MTKEAAIELLKGRKVYVNGKSAEIQKKLFELGWKWTVMGDTKITCLNSPFLYIDRDFTFSHGSNMQNFTDDNRKEISYEEILAIEVVEELKENDVIVAGWESGYGRAKWISVLKKGNIDRIEEKVTVILEGSLGGGSIRFDDFCTAQQWIRKPTEEERQKLITTLKLSSDGRAKHILKEVFGVEECPFKPFDKVLVRDKGNQEWKPALFWKKVSGVNYPYLTLNEEDGGYAQCITYEDHEHLIGTTKSPEE